MMPPEGVRLPGRLVVASRTDVGQVRAANEDSCEVADRSDGISLLIVADGMGGHRGGATASQTAVASIVEVFRAKTDSPLAALLTEAVQFANAAIFELASADPDLQGMGTTVVAFAIDLGAGAHACVAHVGDSRAYRLREGELVAITRDHSFVGEMEQRGLLTAEEAANHPRRNEILRSVGVFAEVEVETSEVDVRGGDTFVLCSDGLTGLVRDPEIEAIARDGSPEEAVNRLVDLANERGGLDNVTVQIARIDEAGAGVSRAASERAGESASQDQAASSSSGRSRIFVLGAATILAACYAAWRLLSS